MREASGRTLVSRRDHSIRPLGSLFVISPVEPGIAECAFGHARAVDVELLSSCNGALAEFDGTFEIAPNKTAIGRDANSDWIPFMRAGFGHCNRGVGPTGDLGMHTPERVFPESSDQAQCRVDVGVFHGPTIRGAQIVEIPVEDPDCRRFIRARQRLSTSFGHFEIPRCMSSPDPLAFGLAEAVSAVFSQGLQ